MHTLCKPLPTKAAMSKSENKQRACSCFTYAYLGAGGLFNFASHRMYDATQAEISLATNPPVYPPDTSFNAWRSKKSMCSRPFCGAVDPELLHWTLQLPSPMRTSRAEPSADVHGNNPLLSPHGAFANMLRCPQRRNKRRRLQHTAPWSRR